MTPFQICPLGNIFNQSIYDTINNRDYSIYENNNADKSDYVWNEINFIDINNNYDCFHGNRNLPQDHVMFNTIHNSKKTNKKEEWQILFDRSGNEQFNLFHLFRFIVLFFSIIRLINLGLTNFF